MLAVHAQLAKEVVGDVLALLHDAVEQVHRLDGLLASRLRTTGSSLHGLLRLDSKLVECHSSILLSFYVYCFLPTFPQTVRQSFGIVNLSETTDDLSHFR